jgi:thiosulfate reductase cytochrome b subunit
MSAERARNLTRLNKVHPLVIRCCHWLSFSFLFLMIWSGLLIYWANPVYRIGWGQTTLFRFFPDWVNDSLHLPQRLAEGMALHFVAMWLFALNGLVYVLYLVFSGQWRHVAPDRHSPRDAVRTVLHDLHLRKEPPAQGKYNGAQRIAYTGVIAMAAGSLLTGLAIYKPIQLSWLAAMLGGYQMARWEHFCLTLGFLLFFIVHVSQVARAGWNNFRSIVTGYTLGRAEAPTNAVRKEA